MADIPVPKTHLAADYYRWLKQLVASATRWRKCAFQSSDAVVKLTLLPAFHQLPQADGSEEHLKTKSNNDSEAEAIDGDVHCDWDGDWDGDVNVNLTISVVAGVCLSVDDVQAIAKSLSNKRYDGKDPIAASYFNVAHELVSKAKSDWTRGEDCVAFEALEANMKKIAHHGNRGIVEKEGARIRAAVDKFYLQDLKDLHRRADGSEKQSETEAVPRRTQVLPSDPSFSTPPDRVGGFSDLDIQNFITIKKLSMEDHWAYNAAPRKLLSSPFFKCLEALDEETRRAEIVRFYSAVRRALRKCQCKH
ncbi:hypothetical protein BDK51DRAFT_50239 [Blyttiomyces helicus]|uniref:Uncharacterized protein n=1 Tax=Blyttiomyces helicus TaxID=388810 RepID=A0A4P9VWV7_9FUNG|nr:hypothetical protein BDK51DRAFT_50239 [Blyttiomyces helicus]|eukprot:RKO83173.1 hypothetical protein BDK51DRAFT_50239 [Blyttiomyces helicus]